MKYLILALASVACLAQGADVYVKPHYDSNGTFVQGHYRTAPDNNPYNNYSTQGNINPYTGQIGNVNPYATPIAPTPVAPIDYTVNSQSPLESVLQGFQAGAAIDRMQQQRSTNSGGW